MLAIHSVGPPTDIQVRVDACECGAVETGGASNPHDIRAGMGLLESVGLQILPLSISDFPVLDP